VLGSTSVAALDGTPQRYATAMVVQSARLLNKNEANGEGAIGMRSFWLSKILKQAFFSCCWMRLRGTPCYVAAAVQFRRILLDLLNVQVKELIVMLSGPSSSSNTSAARLVLGWTSKPRRELDTERDAGVLKLCSLLERIFEHGVIRGALAAATQQTPTATTEGRRPRWFTNWRLDEPNQAFDGLKTPGAMAIAERCPLWTAIRTCASATVAQEVALVEGLPQVCPRRHVDPRSVLAQHGGRGGYDLLGGAGHRGRQSRPGVHPAGTREAATVQLHGRGRSCQGHLEVGASDGTWPGRAI